MHKCKECKGTFEAIEFNQSLRMCRKCVRKFVNKKAKDKKFFDIKQKPILEVRGDFNTYAPPSERFECYIKIGNSVYAKRMASRILVDGIYVVTLNYVDKQVRLRAGDFIIYSYYDVKPCLKEVFLQKYKLTAPKGYKIQNEYIGVL